MARHVLLADDSTTLHRIVRDILEGHGIDLVCTENGEEALRSILESPPGLVLADLNMPRMGGLELCELMRREPNFRSIPVVFLVGPFDEYDDEAARRVGGNGHLIKPFDSFRLMAVVNRFLAPEEEVAVIEPAGDFDGAEELGVSATVEPITDDSLLEAEGAVEDLAELPEPETLVRTSTLGSEEWVSLELSEAEQDLTEDSEELPESAEVVATDEPEVFSGEGSSAEGMDLEGAVRAAVSRVLADVDMERVIREVVQEQVLRVLPGIVETVVRERVQEIEREVEATGVAGSEPAVEPRSS